jgi:hypothetical protein
VDLFFGLRGGSPENGNTHRFGWRLLGILRPKSSIIGLQRQLAMRKARIWRGFLIKERKFPENRNAWLAREDSILDMANSKSDALACLRGAAEPHFVRIHKPLETFEFREPYRIRRVQNFGEK